MDQFHEFGNEKCDGVSRYDAFTLRPDITATIKIRHQKYQPRRGR